MHPLTLRFSDKDLCNAYATQVHTAQSYDLKAHALLAAIAAVSGCGAVLLRGSVMSRDAVIMMVAMLLRVPLIVMPALLMQPQAYARARPFLVYIGRCLRLAVGPMCLGLLHPPEKITCTLLRAVYVDAWMGVMLSTVATYLLFWQHVLANLPGVAVIAYTILRPGGLCDMLAANVGGPNACVDASVCSRTQAELRWLLRVMRGFVSLYVHGEVPEPRGEPCRAVLVFMMLTLGCVASSVAVYCVEYRSRVAWASAQGVAVRSSLAVDDPLVQLSSLAMLSGLLLLLWLWLCWVL